MKTRALLLALVCANQLNTYVAFSTSGRYGNPNRFTGPYYYQDRVNSKDIKAAEARPHAIARSTSLSLFSTTVTLPGRSLLVRGAFAFLLSGLLLVRRGNRRFLYPSIVAPDPSYSHPLPPGSLGCPLLGKLTPKIGSRALGAGSWYPKTSRRLQNASLFKYLLFNKPFAVIGGGESIQQVLGQEFETVTSAITWSKNADKPNPKKKPRFFGGRSLLTEHNKKQHALLRRLIGQSMTPMAVAKSIPNLQAAAEASIDKLLSISDDGVQKMETICNDFTLHVAWRQILGLNLETQQEIEQFHQAVEAWVGGISSLQGLSGIGVANHPGYKAKLWIEAKVEEKIQQLLDLKTPDSSTLSGMVFASDDEGGSRQKLTCQQILDNALLLILAGSETSATTLTNCVLGMGLRKETWYKLVQEQQSLQADYGDELTKEVLDQSLYLEAVMKESMRVKPVASGFPRKTMETLIVVNDNNNYNGTPTQIPKGWMMEWSGTLTHYLDPKTFQEDGSHMDIQAGFVPERWLEESTAPSTDFVPFGAGPRFCLGSNLALTEMKVFLAVFARKVADFALAIEERREGAILKWKRMSIIPKVVDGVPVTVQAR